jgi:hypothetical protein
VVESPAAVRLVEVTPTVPPRERSALTGSGADDVDESEINETLIRRSFRPAGEVSIAVARREKAMPRRLCPIDHIRPVMPTIAQRSAAARESLPRERDNSHAHKRPRPSARRRQSPQALPGLCPYGRDLLRTQSPLAR